MIDRFFCFSAIGIMLDLHDLSKLNLSNPLLESIRQTKFYLTPPNWVS